MKIVLGIALVAAIAMLSGCGEALPTATSSRVDTLVVVTRDTVYLSDTGAAGVTMRTIYGAFDAAHLIEDMAQTWLVTWPSPATDSSWLRMCYVQGGGKDIGTGDTAVGWQLVETLPTSGGTLPALQCFWGRTRLSIHDEGKVLSGRRFKVVLIK
jgi:hypothetical protein